MKLNSSEGMSQNMGGYEKQVDVWTMLHTNVPNIQVFQNYCRGFNNLLYTIHLRQEYMYFLFNRTTLQIFVTYLTGALYVHPL